MIKNILLFMALSLWVAVTNAAIIETGTIEVTASGSLNSIAGGGG